MDIYHMHEYIDKQYMLVYVGIQIVRQILEVDRQIDRQIARKSTKIPQRSYKGDT